MENKETDKEVDWKAVYEESLSMQKCSNYGFMSKIKELEDKIKRMYSEKEVKEMCIDAINSCTSGTSSHNQDFEEWFKITKK